MAEQQEPTTINLFPKISGHLILRTSDGEETDLGVVEFHSSVAVSIDLPPNAYLDWTRK